MNRRKGVNVINGCRLMEVNTLTTILFTTAAAPTWHRCAEGQCQFAAVSLINNWF
jgi:hypothetical protein